MVPQLLLDWVAQDVVGDCIYEGQYTQKCPIGTQQASVLRGAPQAFPIVNFTRTPFVGGFLPKIDSNKTRNVRAFQGFQPSNSQTLVRIERVCRAGSSNSAC